MKTSIRIIIFAFTLLSTSFLFSQGTQSVATMNTGSAIQTKVLPSNIAKQDPLPENLNRIRESVVQNCSKEALQNGLAERENIINSNKNFAELLSHYLHAKSFLDMDNQLFNCASALINLFR